MAQVFPSSGANIQSVFDQSGRLASVWYPNTSTQILGKSYWGATAIYSYSVSKNMGYFAHRDWVGTRRATTNATGAATNLGASLAFGDGASNVSAARTIPTTASPGCGPGAQVQPAMHSSGNTGTAQAAGCNPIPTVEAITFLIRKV